MVAFEFLGCGVGWGMSWGGREVVELVDEVAAFRVEEVDGVLNEWGWVGAGEVVHCAGWAGAEEVGGDLFGEERVGEGVEGDVVDFVDGVEASGVIVAADGAAEEFGGLEGEGDVSVVAGL